MKLKSIFLLLILFYSPLFSEPKIRTIGILVDGSSDFVLELEEKVKAEIIELTRLEYDVQFPKDKRFAGDWDITKIKQAADKLLADKDVDLILALGIHASHIFSQKGDLSKPVVAPFIIDAKLQGIPIKKGHSDIKNYNFVNIPTTVYRDLKFLKEMVSINKMAVLVNNMCALTIPAIINKLENFDLDAETVVIPVFDIESTLENIPADVDAVYIISLVNLDRSQLTKLISKINDRKIPTLSLLGKSDVELGVLATLRGDFFPRIIRRTALNVQSILIGDDAHKILVDFPASEQLIINMETARKIGFYPKWKLTSEAILLNEQERRVEKNWTIEEVLSNAVNQNLDVCAKKNEVAANKENVKKALSNLLPNLSASASGVLIDKDRAEASFGSQAEKTVSASVRGTQLIYSEKAWANYSIQKFIQNSKEYELRQLELDAMFSAANAYVQILRARAFNRIEKNNMDRTKQNLAQAEAKQSIGSGNPAEIYRWQSQVASNKISLIKTQANVDMANLEFNRLLNRPSEETFAIANLDNSSAVMLQTNKLYINYITNDKLFSVFRDFMTTISFENSPELKALDELILAQEKALQSAKNSIWLPTLAIQGEYTSRLDKSGAGSSSGNSDLPFSLPQADDDNWSVALNLSLPLFQGGLRYADKRQAKEEVAKLKTTKEALKNIIETRLRAQLFNSAASFTAIEQSSLANEAAHKTLEIVQDLYYRGAIDILTLLDAQNNALISEQLAADAIYTFLIDLLKVERSAGSFYLYQGNEQSDKFFERLDAFYSDQGIDLN